MKNNDNRQDYITAYYTLDIRNFVIKILTTTLAQIKKIKTYFIVYEESILTYSIFFFGK